MTISQIYQKYQIMPSLQAHQLRVAAVAKQICDNFEGQIDEHTIITACLLHDMGNIIKFNLKLFPEFLEPWGLDYWQKVKDDYIKKYGSNEHHASMLIAEELGVSTVIKTCIDAIGFSKGAANAAGNDMNIKICDYSDNRVDPHGVVSLEARLADLRRRYSHWIDKRGNDAPTVEYEDAQRLMEKQIFSETKIKPSDITDKSSAPIIEQLRTYEI